MKIEFDHPTRGFHYRLANERFPRARRNEVEAMLALLQPQKGQTLLDFGCGNGVLTFPLAQAIGSHGKVYAADISHESLGALDPKNHGNISPLLMQDQTLQLDDHSMDGITSLANFHHVGDKTAMLKQFRRLLRPNGLLVIGDVLEGSPVQHYFDGPVARHCSTGHEHKFLDLLDLELMCQMAGLQILDFQVRQVPWVFENRQDCGKFLHLIHDADVPPSTCVDLAERWLGFHRTEERYTLFWRLFFLTAKADQP